MCHNARRREERSQEADRVRAYNRERYQRNCQRIATMKRARRYERRAQDGQPIPTAPRRWLTAIRASVELGVHEATIGRWVREGKLSATKAPEPHGGLCWYIDPASVVALKKLRGEA